MLLVALFSFGKAAAEEAQARIYIPTFSMTSYEAKEVSVRLDNEVPIAALQFDLDLPSNLSIVGTPEMTVERKANGMQLSYNPDLNRIGIFSFTNAAFKGESGAVLTFKLQAAEGSLDNLSEPMEMKMTGIVISGPSGNPSIKQANQTVKINVQEADFQVTSSTRVIAVTPGQQAEVAMGLDNSVAVAGLQFNVTLPEGVTVDTESFAATSRVSQNTTIVPYVRQNGVVNVQMFDMTGGNIISTGNEGNIVTFNVNIADDFAAETAEIKIDEVVVSALGNQSFEAGELTVSLVNGSEKYQQAMEKVQELRDALEAALATIAEVAPDVKDDFTGEAIEGSINSLVEDIEAAYAQGLLNADYDTVMAPAADIEAETAKLIEDAKAAQAAKEDGDRTAQNRAAYQTDLDALDVLQQSLNHTLSTVALVYPSFDATADGEAAQNAINAARQAALEAFEAVTAEGLYDYTLDTAAIQALIDVIPVNAAYDKANRKIEQLRSNLNDALAQVAEVAPLVKDNFTGADILAQIDALAEAADAAKADGTIAALYDDIMSPEAQINIAIAKLVEDAKAAQAAEEKRRADNEAAYNADLAKIEALRDELTAALAEIAEINPVYDSAAEVAAINTALNDAKTAADNEYAAVAEEGNYASVVSEQTIASVKEMIETMVNNARATGIDDIIYRAEAGELTIYTLDGRKVSEPVKGQVNIFVDANGKAHKAIVR